jgi:hypothetical protein
MGAYSIDTSQRHNARKMQNIIRLILKNAELLRHSVRRFDDHRGYLQTTEYNRSIRNQVVLPG